MSLFGSDEEGGENVCGKNATKNDVNIAKNAANCEKISANEGNRVSILNRDKIKVIEEEAVDLSSLRKVEKLSCYTVLETKLLSQFQAGRLHHATMLSGDFGIGKATFAYWMIGRMLMSDICDKKMMSATMEMLRQNKHPDVFFLSLKDGKNEISVEEVRATLNKVMLKSIYGTKFILIDDINSINANGVNALLKTLEEPPKNTYFFIINHKISPILDTIYSRCNEIKMKISYSDCASALTKLHNDWTFDEVGFYAKIADNSISFAEMLYNLGIMQMINNSDIKSRQNLSELLNKIYKEIDKNNKNLSYMIKISMLSKVLMYCLNSNIVGTDKKFIDEKITNAQEKEEQKLIVMLSNLFIKQFCDMKSFELPIRFV